MTPRIIAGIVLYFFISIVVYIVIRVLDDLSDDGMFGAWLASVFWPGLVMFFIVVTPFWALGHGIDKLIDAVQTRILEEKIRKIREKEKI